jgi:hypothetical protein
VIIPKSIKGDKLMYESAIISVSLDEENSRDVDPFPFSCADSISANEGSLDRSSII